MITFYDTPAREKRPFEPAQANQVRMYSCGPTVWDYAHIGNFRAFLFADVLKRYLQYRGFEVQHVMNLTDVDDRIAQRVRESGVSLREYTDQYIAGFFADLDALNIRRADLYPRATEHVTEMVDLIGRLVERGVAYERDGSVYFSIEQFPAYGEFAHLDTTGMLDGARVDTDKYDKDHARDFVLWKAWTEGDGDVAWDSPFGRGRPGWHVECSAMSMKYLGETFDIHTGGVDLVFPHHQNEVAQSEGATGQKYARFWMHNEFLNIDGEGMSKSLGNQLTLKQMAETPENVRAYRYLVVTSHYRTILNFTAQALEGARSALRRLIRFRDRLAEVDGAGQALPEDAGAHWQELVQAAAAGLTEAMDDDLNAPRAMAAVWGVVGEGEKALGRGDLSAADAAAAGRFLDDADGVFGFFYRLEGEADTSRELPAALASLIEQREAARAAKEWARADELRDELDQAGVEVRDGSDGTEWSWKK